MSPRVTRTGDSGVSLLEVVIAIAVLSIALVGLFRVLNHGLRSAGSEGDRLLAGLIARNQAEELQAGLRGLPERVSMSGRTWLVEKRSLTPDGEVSKVVVSVRPERGGAGSGLVVWLSTSDLR
jgi:general secretion pathway protein I